MGEMGIDSCGLDALLLGMSKCQRRGQVLTLGKQDIHISAEECVRICDSYGLAVPTSLFVRDTDARHFFTSLGFTSLEAMDNSPYEGATLLHDLNKPLSLNLQERKFSLVFDGGTTEHVFNVAQTFDSIFSLIEVGGVFISVTVNNNLSGHGFYQFSPELMAQMCSKTYGMELQGIWLAKIGTRFQEWIPIGTHNWSFSFGDTDRVYVITIAKKVSEGMSLVASPPQQGMYKEALWFRTPGST